MQLGSGCKCNSLCHSHVASALLLIGENCRRECSNCNSMLKRDIEVVDLALTRMPRDCCQIAQRLQTPRIAMKASTNPTRLLDYDNGRAIASSCGNLLRQMYIEAMTPHRPPENSTNSSMFRTHTIATYSWKSQIMDMHIHTVDADSSTLQIASDFDMLPQDHGVESSNDLSSSLSRPPKVPRTTAGPLFQIWYRFRMPRSSTIKHAAIGA